MNSRLRELFPRGSKSFYEANPDSPLPNTVPECNTPPALAQPRKRKAKSVARTRVRFTGYRVRPLDPDNFAGSVKDLLDGLRHAHLIEGDEPWRIDFETAQKKVKSFKEEKTVIDIETP
jgi:hypothetical protein